MRINSDGRVVKGICVMLLFLIALSVFLYTVSIRKPWFGVVAPGHHQWLSGSTLKFSKNWYADGPLKLRFGMVENPDSVEFPDLSSREPYPSYPSGVILPIYALSKLRGHTPTPSLLMKYNLLNHLFIAFFLGLTIFIFLLRIGYGHFYSTLLAMLPICVELLLPAPLYWHQNVFFADQAVILPFVLCVFLELLRGEFRNRHTARHFLNFLQVTVMAYGFFTDWLFVFVGLVVYLKRLFCGELSKGFFPMVRASILFWMPPVLVMALFTLQLRLLGILNMIVGRFLWRTGMSGADDGTDRFFNQFWDGHIRAGYGKFGEVLLWLSLAVFILLLMYAIFQRFRNRADDMKMRQALSLTGMYLLPCFMQIYFLKNHSFLHDFSALKFSIVLATVPFVLIPVLLSRLFRADLTDVSLEGLALTCKGRKKAFRVPVIVCGILLAAGLYLNHVHPKYKKFFPEPCKFFEDVGQFMRANTAYRDVVFSPDFEIPVNPPQLLSYTMKRVYKAASVKEIADKVSGIKKDFTVAVFLPAPDAAEKFSDIQTLISIADETVHQNNFYLYKIEGKKFLTRFMAAR
ncbi:hypothetical protein DENIS_1627 [Desulfonema ishimotonii]|uniref:Glycosyltransferase RgtA/B/C/D-like domain-containing protein n=1 Tax=Desulfonema ishimotonii TaxID=45657 RepID=A0A401FUN7_9BACT|nr:hypothetical protein [Desulfonema ishimotonii]GBC60670.1 hypothetical protein DENIS_1627 [Desulfonema ishimotonii]